MCFTSSASTVWTTRRSSTSSHILLRPTRCPMPSLVGMRGAAGEVTSASATVKAPTIRFGIIALYTRYGGGTRDVEVSIARIGYLRLLRALYRHVAGARCRLRGHDRPSHGRRSHAGGAVRGGGGKEWRDDRGDQRDYQGHCGQVCHRGIL